MTADGRTLRALEIGADLGVTERRSGAPARLAVALTASGQELTFTRNPRTEAFLAGIVDDGGDLSELAGSRFAVGTAMFAGTDFDGELRATPVAPGLVEEGDVLRAAPAVTASGDPNCPFPREPDGLPDAWVHAGGRFTQVYEERAEAVFNAIRNLGFAPRFAWAGSEDGEAIQIIDDTDTCIYILDIEDPAEQEKIDEHREDLVSWLGPILRRAAAH